MDVAPLNSSRRRSLIYAYWPVFLAVLLVVPRLVSAEFGLFDDPAAIRYSQGIANGDWSVLSNDADSGRFRPLYWLQYALTYLLVGRQPFWFYVVNSLVFVTLTGELIWLVRRLGGSQRQGWITGALFVLAGPVIENVYTLMKPELLQLALILGAILPLAGPATAPVMPRRMALFAILSTVLLLLAAMAKETTLLMLPIGLTWLVIAWLASNVDAQASELVRWGAFFTAIVVAVAIYFGIRGQFLEVSLIGGSYSGNFEWNLARYADSAIRWSGWLIRDFAWMLPLGLILLADLLDRKLDQASLLAAAIVWIGAWIAVYIPWEFTLEYYILPVALGVSVVAGIALISAIRRLRNHERRWLTWLALALAFPLWLASLSNNLSNARQQIAVDRANARLLEFLSEEAGDDRRVIINIQQENEYVYELRTHLQDVVGLLGTQVGVFDPGGGLPPGSALIAAPYVHNQPLLAVRMGVIEPAQEAWNQSLQEVLGQGAETAFETEENFRLFIVDLPRLLCSVLPERGYCRAERPLIDTREFQYGWRVYDLQG